MTRVDDDDDDDREPDDCDAREEEVLSMLLRFCTSLWDAEVKGTISYPIFRARVFSSASEGNEEDAILVGCDLAAAAYDFCKGCAKRYCFRASEKEMLLLALMAKISFSSFHLQHSLL